MTDGRPTHLGLFSGIGGFELAAREAGFRTIGFCEIDGYCQRVLAKNFGAILADAACQQINFKLQRSSKLGGFTGQFVDTGAQAVRQTNGQTGDNDATRLCPIYADIRDLDGGDFRGVDLITGGFPCQPFSCAGKRRGAEDDRAIWPEMFRVISEARPAWVVGENVAGIIGMELDAVLSDLEGIGYATRAFIIPACGVDAPHRRNRVWIVANSRSIGNNGRRGECGGSESTESCNQSQRSSEYAGDVADAGGAGMEGSTATGNPCSSRTERNEQPFRCSDGEGTERQFESRLGGSVPDELSRWMDEPPIPRVAAGIKDRVNRLKGLGNAIVPQVAYQILKPIYNLLENYRP